MTANEILDKLIGGQIKLSQALLYTKVLMMDSTSRAQVAWVRQECDGYESQLEVPKYRKIPCMLYSRNSVAFVGEHTKPVDAYELDETYQKESGLSLYTMYVTEGIESLEEFINGSNEGTVSMSLPEHLNKAFRESYTNPSVAILQVYQQAPASGFHCYIVNKIVSGCEFSDEAKKQLTYNKIIEALMNGKAKKEAEEWLEKVNTYFDEK